MQNVPIVNEKLENPRILRLAGGLLFFLGIAGWLLVYSQSNSSDPIRMVLNAALLLALGYPLLLYVRALEKIAVLEQRIRALEGKSK